ncbi:MAG: hypothetical protein RL210_1538 [Pseudomonadota bacterium]|jgi:nucleoid-associated protein
MSNLPNTIQNLIIHRLHKEPNGPARVALNEREVPVNAAAQRLIDQLCQLYSQRIGKGFGKFEDDEAAYPLPALLRQHVAGSLDFVAMSQQMMAQLQQRVEQEPLAAGGHVLIARVSNASMDFLFAAVVSEVIGTGVNEAMQVEDCIHLEMNALRVAGRIDLGAWQTGGERYISFLRGRGDVAQYFKLFLGCNDVVTPLKETQKLVQGLEQFAQSQHMEPEARDQLFERAHSYLDALGDDASPVDLATVAEQVWPDAPQNLQQVLQDENLALSGGFVPDRRAIKPLMRFKASSPEWKLEFDRASLRSGAVIYNKQNDTLVLFNIPEQLRKELLAE